jgi:hypothetical protein
MKSRSVRHLAVAALLSTLPAALAAQNASASSQPLHRVNEGDEDVPLYETASDSIAAIKTASKAAKARDYRVVISLAERKLWVLQATDTVMSAPVGVGTGAQLRHQRKLWIFKTPRGVRSVVGKKTDPVWTPPEWNYVEVAKKHGLKVGHIPRKGVRLDDGRLLTVRDSLVGVVDTDGVFTPTKLEEHIVFGDVLYVPPLGTKNRRIEGELGKYALDTGDGYMLHGTPYPETVGQRSSHGCIRMKDGDIAWLYENVPVGTKVYIY